MCLCAAKNLELKCNARTSEKAYLASQHLTLEPGPGHFEQWKAQMLSVNLLRRYIFNEMGIPYMHDNEQPSPELFLKRRVFTKVSFNTTIGIHTDFHSHICR